MLCIEDLLKLELFQSLPASRLDWICERVQQVQLQSGELLVREGDPARGFFVLVTGSMGITVKSDGLEMPIGQHQAPGFFGEIPVLTDEPVPVTFRALTDCQVYELTDEDFRELMHACRDFERQIFRAVQRRMRGLESFLRNREKMAALGTLSAGLAHELNNPASALVRALKAVPEALVELQRMNLVYGQQQVDDAHTQEWLKARDAGYEVILHQPLDSVTLAEREEELLTWLENYGVQNAWKLSEPLASGGVESQTLDHLMERWRTNQTELRDMGLRWLALSFDVMEMIASGLRGAERISELIQSMKSYSYMDQGAQQLVDIHEGLESTLTLFSHKLKQGIEVRKRYDRFLPRIMVYGSELNQVWTNLIDNAIDAIDAIGETGILEIETLQSNSYIQVQITDSGAGISAELQSRIFEPFFTTKSVGKGSGLGLDVTRRIVENRHNGTLSLQSQPGRTTFCVCLPIERHTPEQTAVEPTSSSTDSPT